MKYLILFLFMLIQFNLSAQDFSLIPYRVSQKWGYSDSLGNIVIKAKYDKAIPFNRGLAAVRVKDLWHFIDESGTSFSSHRYDSVGAYFMGYYTTNQEVLNGIAVYKNGSEHYVDSLGKPIFNDENTIAMITEVPDSDNSDSDTKKYLNKVEIFKNNGLFGYKIKRNNFQVEAQYDSLIYSDTDIMMLFDKPEPYFIAKKNGVWGVITTENSIRLPFQYQAIIEKAYDEEKIFRQDDAWGLMDSEFNILIEKSYDSIIHLTYNYYKVKKGNYWGVVDIEEEIIVPIKNQEVQLSSDNNGFIVEENGKFGYYNKEGENLLKAQYPYLRKIDYRNAFIYANEKDSSLIGYIDTDKGFQIKPEYLEIKKFQNGFAYVTNQAGREGYINEQGKEFFKD